MHAILAASHLVVDHIFREALKRNYVVSVALRVFLGDRVVQLKEALLARVPLSHRAAAILSDCLLRGVEALSDIGGRVHDGLQECKGLLHQLKQFLAVTREVSLLALASQKPQRR